ncbi:hydantoinase/oxoprolinase family protein [Peribacillus cavernae]|uniref:Hydantoinase/oxoprolinase family protein n=1 Tax=Peribacillus cavernae TaxID=1674310 RepID=A0A433HFE3_9BACI|nr:hydantoinase/oxoprolinase family protein [Peribacillus cavernae]MDQ0219557.1 N-methylhydantoinase A [Peribacillus cavernae]RUQ27036.1 hydantoinase/oxoprolinase family protein [Peribacillus cavernae]
MSWRIGIDTGGTFTDLVALNDATGEEKVFKTSSTPNDPSRAFLDGIQGVLDEIDAPASDIAMLLHGTTVATNAVLEGKYSRLGLIVSKGYRDMLEVARQNVPGEFGAISYWIKPPRIVPLELVRETDGRLNYRGEELRPLDEKQIRLAAREYRELGVKAIAVSFIHSYQNPAHEERAREIIQDEYPDCFVSISADVIREYREYERTLTTCLNTGLMPLLSTYLDRLGNRTREAGTEAPLYVMKSSGGVATVGELIKRPIAASLSGPAAGVIAAAAISKVAGVEDVLTLDMGGTSTDMALIEGGIPRLLTEGKIDIYDIKAPMIDMTTVGAGGGSIAWLAGSKALRVGPQSAGSTPGPACYGRGGTEPTITDANLVLGRIPPYLLGGSIPLDREAAYDAIKTKIAEPLGLSVEKAAAGILEIATQNISAGIRVVSVRRGRDPRNYALFPFGGAGGLLVSPVANALDMKSILVPASPGATAAAGLLYSDVRVDHVITDVQREDELDVVKLNDEFLQVRNRVKEDLASQGFASEGIRLQAFIDMRYVGQAFEIRVPLYILDGSIASTIAGAIKNFHATHEDQYGYSYENKSLVEIVNIGVTGFGQLAPPRQLPKQYSVLKWSDLLKFTRPLYISEVSDYVNCPVYERPTEPISEQLAGPAVIEQYDTTTVVEPGWVVTVNEYGHLLITRNPEGGAIA